MTVEDIEETRLVDIETHFADMLKVVLSIKTGKVTASTLLKKLSIIVEKTCYIRSSES